MLQESINDRADLESILRNLHHLQEASDLLPISPTHEILWHCLNTLPLSAHELKQPAAVPKTLLMVS
jgi:hypothetical protein